MREVTAGEFNQYVNRNRDFKKRTVRSGAHELDVYYRGEYDPNKREAYKSSAQAPRYFINDDE